MAKLKSRKFLLAVAGAILIVLNDGLGWGIDPEAFNSATTLLVTWIAAEGAYDATRAWKTGR